MSELIVISDNLHIDVREDGSFAICRTDPPNGNQRIVVSVEEWDKIRSCFCQQCGTPIESGELFCFSCSPDPDDRNWD